MSSIKIRDLVEKTDSLVDDDLMVIEDNEDTKKISLIKLKSAFSMDGNLTAIKNMLLEKIEEFIASHDSRCSELEHRNKQLNITCTNLDNDHIHDAERIFELENRLIVETNNIEELQFVKTQLLEMITQLQNDKDALSDEILKLKLQISNDQELIEQLATNAEELQTNIADLTELNTKLEETVAELEQASTENIEDNFTEANEKLNSSIQDLLKYIRHYHPDVDEIFGLEE